MAEHWVAVASYATRFLDAGRDAGDDVAQEVFLLVWGGGVAWDGRSSVRGFLLGVARKLCQNRRRRRSVRARLTGQVRARLLTLQRSASPAEILEEAELRRRLETVLDGMPERRRESFLLIRMQGLSYAEAAEVMQVSPQTVANQMSAALKDLRRAL